MEFTKHDRSDGSRYVLAQRPGGVWGAATLPELAKAMVGSLSQSNAVNDNAVNDNAVNDNDADGAEWEDYDPISVTDAARLVGCTRQHLSGAIRRGELEAFADSTGRRLHLRHVEEWANRPRRVSGKGTVRAYAKSHPAG